MATQLKDKLPMATLSHTKEIEEFYQEMNEPYTTLGTSGKLLLYIYFK